MELEAGDLGEYHSCGVQGLGEPLESGDCFQLGLFCVTPGMVGCGIVTSTLVTAQGVILLGWEFVA